MRGLMPLAITGLAAAAIEARKKVDDTNTEADEGNWFAEAIKRERNGNVNASDVATISPSHSPEGDFPKTEIEDGDQKWKIQLDLFSDMDVAWGEDLMDEDATIAMLRYMAPENLHNISDSWYVSGYGFAINDQDHSLGDDEELEADCSNVVSDECLEALRAPNKSWCHGDQKHPESCPNGNMYKFNIKNATSDPEDPALVWVNVSGGDGDGNSLSGDGAYDHGIRQVYVATLGLYQSVETDYEGETSLAPTGNATDYSNL
ncbi:uncharacterized protein F5Z01DRAFT_676816 [Emericellopsis atlantica]|uniref:Uncharacterized protein n=1 Tax=Emericellopsis atlantica TaxID=2614577 RepID=A0A9P7ZHK8_9HYPO|nr:uncharacterized protein F5Z01DRAFT_676816 [Emericellopsis atlantica]KAG9251628.1 hypothetical protein F5Z01DRAFT_676816 [Emericellopsis atlantica]